MAVPAPTPYSPLKYSTSSADDFNGEPLIEQLHGFPHVGQDDYDTTSASYGKSVAGVFIIVVAVGFTLTLGMLCVNCCACCKCCRKKLPCSFGLFQGHPLKGKLTVIGLFLVTAVVATTGYVGRNEFNAAVFEAGDQIRELGDTFNTLEGSTTELTLHASSIASDTTSSACSDSGTTSALEGASTGLSGAADVLSTLLEGVGDLLYDTADLIEAEMPGYVDAGLASITTLVWVNCILGSLAILTKHCKTDDCFALFIGSITLLMGCVLVGVSRSQTKVVASWIKETPDTPLLIHPLRHLFFCLQLELMLAVTVADFCYKGPEEVIQAITKDPLIIYYVTCNGTNPLSQQFDESRNMVRAGGTCLYSYTYSYN